MTEDFGKSNSKDTPYVYVAGGISAAATYGLGMYNALIISVSMDGVIYNGSGREAAGNVEGDSDHPNANAFTTSGILGGSSLWGTSGCFTALD